MQDLYFGYSQTSIWDLESNSKPFLDTSYRPSLFWRKDRIERWSSNGLQLGLEAGLEHESNGRDEPGSRSINIAYAKPRWDWPFSDDDHFIVEPKVWAYLEKGENPDIDDLRGYFNLRVGAYDADGLGVASDMRLGRDPDHGYLELGLTYPMNKMGFGNLEGFFFVQYVNGWGESILVYDQKAPSQIRIGISLVRW